MALDLSRAYSSATVALDFTPPPDSTWESLRREARTAVDAALPHLLEELAQQSIRERYPFVIAHWLREKAKEIADG